MYALIKISDSHFPVEIFYRFILLHSVEVAVSRDQDGDVTHSTVREGQDYDRWLKLINIFNELLSMTMVVGHIGHPDIHLFHILITVETAIRGRIQLHSRLCYIGNFCFKCFAFYRQSPPVGTIIYSNPLTIS